MSEDKEFLYANGMNASNASKVCKYLFGDYFREVVKNKKTRNFDIFIYDKIEVDGRYVDFKQYFSDEFVARFKEYWGGSNGFNLVMFKILEDQL